MIKEGHVTLVRCSTSGEPAPCRVLLDEQVVAP